MPPRPTPLKVCVVPARLGSAKALTPRRGERLDFVVSTNGTRVWTVVLLAIAHNSHFRTITSVTGWGPKPFAVCRASQRTRPDRRADFDSSAALHKTQGVWSVADEIAGWSLCLIHSIVRSQSPRRGKRRCQGVETIRDLRKDILKKGLARTPRWSSHQRNGLSAPV